jgi:UDP-GlcNAc:undecaprenyl-phosphate GlcNAc-1-phosphate transferase
MSKIFLLPLMISAVISFAATYPVIKFAWKFGLIDDPRKHKHPKVIHTKPTPRAGGLAIFLGVVIPALIFLPFDKHLKGILAGAFILVSMGILDDFFISRKKDLSPYIRLIIQFIAAAMPIAAGIGIAFWKTPFGQIIDLSHPQIQFQILGQVKTIWLLADLFALFWIVIIINFLNMGAKGVDGQLSGVVAIAALSIAALSIRFSADITEWPVIILAAITLACLSPKNNAKLFWLQSGGLFIGCTFNSYNCQGWHFSTCFRRAFDRHWLHCYQESGFWEISCLGR